MRVNILDINATVHLSKAYASLIKPEHVRSVLERYGFKLKESTSRFCLYSHIPDGLSSSHETIAKVPSYISEDWHLRLNEVLQDVEDAIGEKQLMVLHEMLKEAGHTPVLE